MEPKKLLEILHTAERLKDATRHCDTSGGRRESVAEHCWRAALMAYLMKEEFPEADMQKVMLMCVLHDLGEAFTGDIPTFHKTEADAEKEEAVLKDWINHLPKPYCVEMLSLFNEMEKLETQEAKIYKAIDGLEAVIQHNEAAIESWLPLEYELNLTYANDKVAFSDYLTTLRQEVRDETLRKMETERKK